MDFIRQRIREVYQTQRPRLDEFRDHAKRLKNGIREIEPRNADAVSFISTDGGENRLYFNPAVIEIIRVFDSRGNLCAFDALGNNTTRETLNSRGRAGHPAAIPVLQKLCAALNKEVAELSRFLKGFDTDGNSVYAAQAYREILEWAVLYDFLDKEWANDTVLIREGMLRSLSFDGWVFPLLHRKIEEKCLAHEKKSKIKVSVAGVAKKNAVLSKLSIALSLEKVFQKPYPCYVAVPEDIQKDCYNYDFSWITTAEGAEGGQADAERKGNGESAQDKSPAMYQSMGKLYLVKFGERPFDPVWPIDIAVWDRAEAAKIIGRLLRNSQNGFPIPDFPSSIQKAHDYASIGGIEASVLQDLLVDEIMRGFSNEEVEGVLRMRYLWEDLTKRRYYYG